VAFIDIAKNKKEKCFMNKTFKLLLLLAMFATTALAQVPFDKGKIPADTRLYLQMAALQVSMQYRLAPWAPH
jgi:hypothetical protein